MFFCSPPQLYEQNIATDHNRETAVLRVTATDIDTLENADIRYSLDNTISDDSSYFSINENTGIINLVKPLDDNMVSDALHAIPSLLPLTAVLSLTLVDLI